MRAKSSDGAEIGYSWIRKSHAMASKIGADGMGLAVDQRTDRLFCYFGSQKGLRGARVRDDAAGVSWSPWTYSAATGAAELLPWPVVVAIMHGPTTSCLAVDLHATKSPGGEGFELSAPRTDPLVLTPPHIPE
jgi:hypothetical protein